MGHGFSRSDAASRNDDLATNDADVEVLSISPGVLGFVSLLIGTAKLPVPPISCADALMDMVAEADALWSLAAQETLPPSAVNSVRFVPYILSKRFRELRRLPMMTVLEKWLYFSSTICVVAHREDGWSAVLSVANLNEINKLNARLTELVAARNHTQRANAEECGICMDEVPTCVLPCGHQLCDSCEKLWVRRQLNCPFCRAHMGAKEVRRGGWQLASYSEEDLSQDIKHLSSRVNLLWDKMLSKEEVDKLLEHYEMISRQLDPFREERDGFVFL